MSTDTVRHIRQTKFGDPDGNCWQACLAMVIGCELDEVPIIVAQGKSAFGCMLAANDWLNGRGYGLFVTEWWRTDEQAEPGLGFEGAPYIACGPGPRGLRHAVVRWHAKEWDPHPSDAGLLSVDEIDLVVVLPRTHD